MWEDASYTLPPGSRQYAPKGECEGCGDTHPLGFFNEEMLCPVCERYGPEEDNDG